MEESVTAVSVLICVRNAGKYIINCLRSFLEQTITDFEIIIVDEFDSNDNTREYVAKFNDKRIRYFKNSKLLGISKSRNLSLRLARGDYVFFTDGDCLVAKNWIEEGLKFLKRRDCGGVEGKSYYLSKEYAPTFSDHTYGSEQGRFMTNNIAYKKAIIESVGGFDERYNYHEDRDIALKTLKTGNKIEYNPKMVVYVQKETLTPKGLIRHSPILKNRVYLYNKFRDQESRCWRIIDPWTLAKIMCPILIFTSLFSHKFEASDDYKLLPFTYVKAILERVELWRECAKEKTFLI